VLVSSCDSTEWKLVAAVSDEFDGPGLDTEKWLPFNHQWRGRPPGWFCPENVFVEDGCLILTCCNKPPPPGQPSEFKMRTAFVRSREMVLYGWFEFKCTPANSITSSSLWLSRNTPETWNEIDICELSAAPKHVNKFHTNAHVFREGRVQLEKPRSWQETIELPFNVTTTMTVVLDWSREALKWIVNGRIVRVLENTSWHEPMHIQMDCETMENWFGPVAADDPLLPSRFKVHYVRGWQR
jgi:beta-glucanase (GH16 family)